MNLELLIEPPNLTYACRDGGFSYEIGFHGDPSRIEQRLICGWEWVREYDKVLSPTCRWSETRKHSFRFRPHVYLTHTHTHTHIYIYIYVYKFAYY